MTTTLSSRRLCAGIGVCSAVLGFGVAGLLGVAGALPVRPAAPLMCQPPALPGTVVDASLTDMGAMMGGGMMGSGGMMGGGMMGEGNDARWPHMGAMGAMGMMRIVANPATVAAGQVSFRVANTGTLNHEVVVLPLAQGQSVGQRPVGADGKVDETGSLGEASKTCGADAGEESADPGIAPGAIGWTTLTLKPGRYELLCNIAGHYGAGMYTQVTVT